MEGFRTAGHIIYYILCHADGILNNALNMHVRNVIAIFRFTLLVVG